MSGRVTGLGDLWWVQITLLDLNPCCSGLPQPLLELLTFLPQKPPQLSALGFRSEVCIRFSLLLLPSDLVL